MASTNIAKPSLATVAAGISAEYPSIFASPQDMMLFEGDFKLLVRTFVTERHVSDAELPGYKRIKASRVHEIVNRKMTKAYDLKAQAAGRPTLLMRAVEEAKGRDRREVNDECYQEMTSMFEAKGMTPQEQKKFMAAATAKVMKRSKDSANASPPKTTNPFPFKTRYNQKPPPPMFAKAMEIADEYPDIFSSKKEKQGMCEDFSKLVRLVVQEEGNASGLKSTRPGDSKEEILNRKTTKKSDEKATASNRPTFLDLAKEQAKGLDLNTILMQSLEAMQWMADDDALRAAASK